MTQANSLIGTLGFYGDISCYVQHYFAGLPPSLKELKWKHEICL